MPERGEHLLIVEDDPATRANLRDILELADFKVESIGSFAEAFARPDWSATAAVVLDRRLSDGFAEDVLPRLKEAAPETTFIIVTGHHDLAGAIACLRRGAEDYILKPLNADALLAALRRALERRRDRTALRLAEQELRLSQAQLRQADRLASIGTLAAGLGHDMSNVLLPVRARLDVIDAAGLPDHVRSHLATIREAVAYLQSLSDGLHLLALDPSDDEASGAVTDIVEWWRQVGSLLAKTVPKSVSLECTILASAGRLPRVNVTPHRLTQAVLNLLVNAGEAIAGEGRVRLWAEPATDESAVRLGVTDTGEGMSEEVRRRALEPFFTTKKRGLGTGLGLSLVHGVVQAAGGTVDITSRRGRGTTIVLNLPAASRATAPAALHGALGSAAISVGDDRLASFIGSFLTAAGFDEVGMTHDLPHGCRVWVVDPQAVAIRSARQFLRGGNDRRIVLVGDARGDWAALASLTIDDPDDFDAVRRTVAALSRSMAGE